MNHSEVIDRWVNDFMQEHAYYHEIISTTANEAINEIELLLSQIYLDAEKLTLISLVKKRIVEGFEQYKVNNPNNLDFRRITEDFLMRLQSIEYEIIRYEDQLSKDDLLQVTKLVDSLQERIEALERNKEELDQYIAEIIQEFAEIKLDLQTMSKRQAKRQFVGSMSKIGTLLAKAGFKEDEILKILYGDWNSIPSILENSINLTKMFIS